MAINFPSTSGQATDGSFTHTVNNVTWKWDGTTWKGSTSGSGLSNIADSAQGVNVTGKVATTDGIDIDTGGNINAAGTSVDFGSATVSFSGATISGLSGSDVSLGNIANAAYGVDITGKAALTDGIDIDIGGSINAAGTSIDFQNTTISFTGTSIGGLQSTINGGVDVHLNKSTAGTNEVLSWNGTDYDWVAQSAGTTLFTGLTDTPSTLTAGKWLKVNAGGTALEETDGPPTFARAQAIATTASLAPETAANLDIPNVAKAYALYSIGTDQPAWVTLYTSQAARTADANRAMTMDPVPGSGVIAEIITGGNYTQWVSPMLMGYNNEATPVSTVYAKVHNKKTTAVAVQITITYLPLEV